MQPPHRARLILMREGTLKEFSPPPQQTLAALTFHTPPVGIHRRRLFRFAFPVAPWLPWSRNISSDASLDHRRQTRAAVIALVCHHFAHPLFMHLVLALR